MKIISTAIACLVTCFSVLADTLPNEVKLMSEGEEITVSVYELNEPLIIRPLYEPRDDLDEYPWLKPLLFTLNAYALSIPKEEWPEYGEGDWPQERYDSVEKTLTRLRKACLENPETWGNKAMYHELNTVVLCKVDGTTYLEFNLIGKKIDGTVFGDQTKRLKLVDGKWMNPYEPELGKKRAKQLHHCSKEVMNMIEKEELASIPIGNMK